jgi:hypothetical protein
MVAPVTSTNNKIAAASQVHVEHRAAGAQPVECDLDPGRAGQHHRRGGSADEVVSGPIVDGNGQVRGQRVPVGGLRRAGDDSAAARGPPELPEQGVTLGGQGADPLGQLGDRRAVGGQRRRAVVAVLAPRRQALEERPSPLDRDPQPVQRPHLGHHAHIELAVVPITVAGAGQPEQAERLVVADGLPRHPGPRGQFTDPHRHHPPQR